MDRRVKVARQKHSVASGIRTPAGSSDDSKGSCSTGSTVNFVNFLGPLM